MVFKPSTVKYVPPKTGRLHGDWGETTRMPSNPVSWQNNPRVHDTII